MLSPFVQRKIAWAFCKYDQSQNGQIEKEDLLLIPKRVAESFGFKEGDRKDREIIDAYTIPTYGMIILLRELLLARRWPN